MSKINLKLILPLLFFGILMGAAGVLGLLGKYELIIWLPVFMVCAFILAKFLTAKFFVNGFVLGFLLAVLSSAIQVIFFDHYINNNPQLKSGFEKLPSPGDAKIFFIMMAPLIGLLSGITLGVFTTAFKKLIFKK
ncbi:MAG: hypothetical protein IPM56_16330 [Ignavibacteriales bacterium]|nr:MAG: hypothetical protein IPM56_16330 [Ignavibacteriales bacterium]